MDSSPTLKPKVTVKLNYDKSSMSRIPSRPASPAKSYASSSVGDPTFRPKAKVNSSAKKNTNATGNLSTLSSSTSSTPRAGSPAKLTPRVKSVVNGARSPPGMSTSATPELRKVSSSLRAEDSRSRASSISLHHAASFSTFQRSSSSVVSSSKASGSMSASASPRMMPTKSVPGQNSPPTLRIRSKVSNLAKAAADSASPPLSPEGSTTSPQHHPLYPSTRPADPRTRAPSTSSAVSHQHSSSQLSTSPPPQFYPITTAVPAANPHRFPSTRPPSSRTSPVAGHRVFQSFSQPSGAAPQADSSSRPRSANGLLNGSATAKVDPASIPLPPHSPPASAVSFSSRSSLSRSSFLGGSADPYASDSGSLRGTAKKSPQLGGPDNLRATLDNLMLYSCSAAEDEDGDSGHDRETEGEGVEEHKVKAAAKSNRKIADLEITNRSLLVINASLEATKHKQAKEIHELRRKLRESRLILPPRAYRAVKSSLGPAEIHDDEEEVEDDEEEVNGDEGLGDEIYKRVKLMMDTLLKSGQEALEKQVKDFREGGRGTAKVLSPEEQKDWRGTNGIEQDYDMALDGRAESGPYTHERRRFGGGQEGEDESHDDYDGIDDRNLRDDNIFFFDNIGNETVTSEDEVEAMTIPAFSPSSSPPPPPILITQPT